MDVRTDPPRRHDGLSEHVDVRAELCLHPDLRLVLEHEERVPAPGLRVERPADLAHCFTKDLAERGFRSEGLYARGLPARGAG